MDFFRGRKLVIATMHHKEIVMAPKVASKLGVLPLVPSGLNTDQLGTFSGEIERALDPLSTARRKCELAMELTGVDLAIASEGSFGIFPNMFIPGNEEIVLLLDKKNKLEIVGKKLSIQTNFAGQLCCTTEELFNFAQTVDFPEHGLILRDNRESVTQIFKGICNKKDLQKKFKIMIAIYGHAFVETDMRALYNPMRMQVIGEATDAMLEKATVCCEKCSTPGFGFNQAKSGLRCRQCGLPTRSIQTYVYSCSKCGFSKEQPNPDKFLEEPVFCDYCNP